MCSVLNVLLEVIIWCPFLRSSFGAEIRVES